MRWALPLLSLLSPLALAAFWARARPTEPPPAPARPQGAALPLRVHIALQAAARARR